MGGCPTAVEARGETPPCARNHACRDSETVIAAAVVYDVPGGYTAARDGCGIQAVPHAPVKYCKTARSGKRSREPLPRRTLEEVNQGTGYYHPLLSTPLNSHPCAPPALSPITGSPAIWKRFNPNTYVGQGFSIAITIYRLF